MSHKVLVIDSENQTVYDSVLNQLALAGFEILHTEDVQKAMHLLSDHTLSIDVIVCDLEVPADNMDAIAYFRREYPCTPVIVLTDLPNTNIAVDFMKRGVREYLIKPIADEILFNAVNVAARERKIFCSYDSVLGSLRI